MVRSVYTKEFKIKAIELLEESKKPLRQVARELGVAENNLYNWRNQYSSNQEKAFPNQPQLNEKDLELRRLKARIAELEEEREILKNAALIMAIQRNKPPQGVIHHSDRGSQYSSNTYQSLLKENSFVCSMSGSGNCYDNAVMESFYHTLKVELIYGCCYKTRNEAQLALFDYIEVFYNRKRIHSTLGFQTPNDFGTVA